MGKLPFVLLLLPKCPLTWASPPPPVTNAQPAMHQNFTCLFPHFSLLPLTINSMVAASLSPSPYANFTLTSTLNFWPRYQADTPLRDANGSQNVTRQRPQFVTGAATFSRTHRYRTGARIVRNSLPVPGFITYRIVLPALAFTSQMKFIYMHVIGLSDSTRH